MTVQPYSATAQVKSLAGTAAAPGITFTGDIDTGLFSPGANQVAVTTGGVQRLLIGADGSITPSGSFLFPAGTAASPSVSFTGDPNTGIFSPGADQLSVATNGTERLRINATGQVGAVSLGTAAAPAYTFTGDPNTGIYSPGADQVAVATNGAGRLFVDANGRVGVNKSAPTSDLQINRELFIKADSGGDDTHGIKISSGPLVVDANSHRIRGGGGTGQLLIIETQTTSGNGSILLSTNGSERLRITSAGLVGIGTSSPGELLDVAGSIRQTGNTAGTTNTVGLIDFYNANNTTTIARVNVRTDGAANSGSYRISTANAGTLNEVVRITSGGRVGIGTTSPLSDLHLHGATSGVGPIFNLTNDTGDCRIFFGQNTSTGSANAAGQIRYSVANNTMAFYTNLNERARIDSSGRLLVGTSTTRDLGGFSPHIFEGVNASSSGLVLIRNSNNVAAGYLYLGKTRGTSVGANTIVQANDDLGTISFNGADGTDMVSVGARIQCQVDGTPGVDDMPGRLVFSTTAAGASSPTERMRIRNDGEVLINKTSSFETVHSLGVFKANNTLGVGTDAGSGQEAVRFYNGATAVGTIATTTSTTAYNTSSDYRLKENVVDLDGAIDRLKLLPVHRFNFIADPDTVVDGFIAHEVQTIVPEAITGEKDAVDDDGNPVYQGIDQSKLVPLLTAALQEAIGEIESLKARVAALESA
jgi:hypothetical protein